MSKMLIPRHVNIFNIGQKSNNLRKILMIINFDYEDLFLRRKSGIELLKGILIKLLNNDKQQIVSL